MAERFSGFEEWLVIASSDNGSVVVGDVVVGDTNNDDESGSEFSFESIQRAPSSLVSDDNSEPINMDMDAHPSPESNDGSSESDNVLEASTSIPALDTSGPNITEGESDSFHNTTNPKKKKKKSTWRHELETPMFWMRHFTYYCYGTSVGECCYPPSGMMRCSIPLSIKYRGQVEKKRLEEQTPKDECCEDIFWVRNNTNNKNNGSCRQVLSKITTAATPSSSLVALSVDSNEGGVLLEINHQELFWLRNGKMISLKNPVNIVTSSINDDANKTTSVKDDGLVVVPGEGNDPDHPEEGRTDSTVSISLANNSTDLSSRVPQEPDTRKLQDKDCSCSNDTMTDKTSHPEDFADWEHLPAELISLPWTCSFEDDNNNAVTQKHRPSMVERLFFWTG